MLSLLLAIQAQPLLERDAFFCAMESRLKSTADSSVVIRPLSLLLSKTVDKASTSDPIETFDPTGLLKGAKFDRFSDQAGSQNFAFLTGSTASTRTFLLALRPDGDGFRAVLGNGGPDSERNYVGRCFPLRSGNAKAEFDEFNAGMKK